LISDGPAVPFDTVYDSIREQLDDYEPDESFVFIAPIGATLEQVNEALDIAEKEMQAELGEGVDE
jgi:hypothetical protein